MQGLYHELWGKELQGIEDRTFSIPYPGHSFRPGYKVDLKEIGDGAFPDSEFEEGKEEKVFKVLEVMSVLPCGTDRLLVRQEYEAIEHDLLQSESKKWTKVNSKTGIPMGYSKLDYRLGGQPGSGKSFFLSYLLVRRLLAGQPTAFRLNDNVCFLFDSNSRGGETDANFLFHLPDDQKRALWILTDGKLEDPRWCMKNQSWLVVLAASPCKVKDSHQWKKDRNPASRYMSNWGWDEIIAAFILARSEPPTPSQITMLFTTFTSLGPIARICLQTIPVTDVSDYNSSYKAYVSDIDHEITTFILQGGFLTVEHSVHQNASHRIAIMQPSDDGRMYDPQIATRWIVHKVYEKTQLKSQLRCFELYNQLASQGRLRTAAGWMFEGFAHDWFRNGGFFKAHILPIEDNNTPPLIFTTSRSESLNYFKNADTLAKEVRVKNGHGIKQEVIGKYFLPYNANFESVDGLVFSSLNTLILLQITIAESHGIKLRGLQKLCESLPDTIKNIHIVFVIPQDRMREYSRNQSVPDATYVKPRATDLTIKQFRLVLKEKIMKTMILGGPFKAQDRSGGIKQFRLVLKEKIMKAMVLGGPFKVQDRSGGPAKCGSRDCGGDTAMGGTQ